MSVKGLSFLLLLTVIALLPVWMVPGAEGPVAQQKEGAVASETAFAKGFLGPELLISQASGMPETERFAPAVAADWVRGQYLVVWHNKWPGPHRDIYARRVANDGRLLSWFAITAGPNDRMQPAVAFNAADAEYLVVWMHDVSGNGSQYEIWGKIVAWDGSYRKPEFQIISYPGRTFWTPRVVWNHNRNQYLVVWNAIDTTSGLPTDVSSMLLDRKGNKITGRILTTSTYPQQADVAYGWNKDEYLVVFVRTYTQATTGNDIYGLRVSADNAVVSPPGVITIHSGAKDQNGPRVIADGQGDYMVVWEHAYQPADHDIYGRKVDKNGNPVGGSFVVSNWPQDERSPAVTANFSANPEYVATWQRATPTGQVLAARRWSGGLVGQYFEVTEGEFWETVNPAIAANPPNYFFAWEGDSTANPTVVRHIYGRQWASNAVMIPLVVRNKQ